MHFDVLVQISSLGELFAAVVVRAGKGSFACVHTQMVEEVMPLPELLVAPTIVVAHRLACAQQDFNHALGKRVHGRENEELLSLRDILEVPDFVVEIFEVKFAARSNLHHDRISSGRDSRKLLDLTYRKVV